MSTFNHPIENDVKFIAILDREVITTHTHIYIYIYMIIILNRTLLFFFLTLIPKQKKSNTNYKSLLQWKC